MMYHSSLAPHCLMENDIMNTSPEIADHNPMVIDGIPSHMFSGALVHPDSLAVDSRSQIMAGYPLVSTFQEHINNLQDDLQITNHGVVIGDGASISRCILPSRQANGDVSVSRSHSISNSEFQGQFMGGASQSATPLASVTETSKTLHENFDSVTISATSAFPLEDLSAFVPNGCCNTSNSSLTASVNWEYNGGHGNMELIAPKKDSDMTGRLDGKWDFEKFLGSQELTVKILTTTMCEPCHVIGSSEPPGWISSNKSNSSTDNPYGYCMPGNELSLSLATCQPSIISVPSIPDQCSEKSCSGVTQHSLHEVGLGMGLGLEQTFCKSKELSLGFGSYRSVHFSHILSGSKYLHVAQQILTEIASYSLENLDNISYSPGGIGTGAKIFFSKDCLAEREVSVMDSAKSPFSVGKTRFESQIKLTLQRQEVEAKKAQLLALLQVADNRYSQCLDEIHAVISAFDAATELDPQIHTRFVLQTFSLLYSNLRERITKAIGELLSGGCLRQESSCGSSLIQKQLTLQQIRSEDHQSWRPQRGLPERSVSVLRAWMFQNFLHPYPKDEEKHLLAIRSGLTRNQVSNWFINARVRLWKPMIEEMYSEMSNKRVRRTEEGTNNDVWYHIKH